MPTWRARRNAVIRLAGLASAAGLPFQGRALAAARATNFYPTVRPRALVFPRDFGAHPDFRTEWWYLTGWLGQGAQAVGFQVTFFRSKTRHPQNNPSRFAPKQLLFAHAALAIAGEKQLLHADRAARSGVADASFSDTDTQVQIGNWQLKRTVQAGQEIGRAHV